MCLIIAFIFRIVREMNVQIHLGKCVRYCVDLVKSKERENERERERETQRKGLKRNKDTVTHIVTNMKIVNVERVCGCCCCRRLETAQRQRKVKRE